ncbi:MAG: hypothetical protein ACRDM7_09425 [Thermoleophilaceae bacterium]
MSVTSTQGRPMPRALARAGALAVLLSMAVAGSAAAHGGHSSSAATQVPAGGPPVKLRGCFLTATFIPRPASILQPVFRRPLDLSQTFYGPDPLLGVWGFDCDGARVAGRRVGRVIASLVAVPVGLTSAGAAQLANNFAHSIIRIDTSSPVLARALRRAGLPGRLVRSARYRHSPRGRVPSSGRLVVPGGYEIAVSASDLDPTNPHDHLNRFEHRGRSGRISSLSLSSQDAADRFCFPASRSCSATVRAPRGSALARLLGGRSAPAVVGFDHEQLARIDLDLRRGR